MTKSAKPMSSLSAVTSAIKKLENERNLLTWKVAGTYPWVLMRTTVLRLCNERLGNYEARKESGHTFDPNVPKRLGTNVIVKFLRTDANGVDKFSKPVTDALNDEAVELSFGHVKTFAKTFYDRYKYLAAALVLPFIPKKAKLFWRELIEEVETALSVDLSNIKRFPRGKLIHFKAERLGWYLLFKGSGTKRVFMVNAWNKPLLAGAQAAGAWFVEPQHGLFSGNSGLISFPGTKRVAYYPDEFYFWGKSWSGGVGIPEDVKQTVIGHPRSHDFARSTELVKGNVIVLSGAFHSQRLSLWTIDAAKRNPKLNFTIKLHPQEYMRDFADYDFPKNVQVVDSTVSTLDMMRKSEYAIGVFSTGLLEAISIGCKSVVIKMPGWEHLENFINKGLLYAIEPDEVLDFAKVASPPKSLDLFGEPVSNEFLLEHINQSGHTR